MAMQQFSRSLPMMLYRTLDAVMPRFRSIFNEFGLTEQQWRVLRVLWEGAALPLSELAELTLLPAPSLVGVVDRLERAGFVSRRRSDQDRRVVFVAATRKASEIEPEVMRRVAGAYAELKQSMDPQVWEQLLAGLEQVCSVSQARPRRKASP